MWIIYMIIVFVVFGWVASLITPDVPNEHYNPDFPRDTWRR